MIFFIIRILREWWSTLHSVTQLPRNTDIWMHVIYRCLIDGSTFVTIYMWVQYAVTMVRVIKRQQLHLYKSLIYLCNTMYFAYPQMQSCHILIITTMLCVGGHQYYVCRWQKCYLTVGEKNLTLSENGTFKGVPQMYNASGTQRWLLNKYEWGTLSYLGKFDIDHKIRFTLLYIGPRN